MNMSMEFAKSHFRPFTQYSSDIKEFNIQGEISTYQQIDFLQSIRK